MREWPHSVLFETGNTKVDNAIDATACQFQKNDLCKSDLGE